MSQPTQLDWLRERFENDDTDECIIIPTRQPGYVKVWTPDGNRWAHIIVCEWANGPRPDGLVVAHSCGNGRLGCLNRRHLRWTTQSDNLMDRRAHGTNVTGKRSKLTTDDVLAIRDDSRMLRDVAMDYGVSEPTISEIRNRKTWTWL